MPEFDNKKIIEWTAHVDESTKSKDAMYDMIIGTDLLIELGISLNFNTKVIEWDYATVPMKNKDIFLNKQVDKIDEQLLESDSVKEATSRMKAILDAKYQKIDLNEYTSKLDYLSLDERDSLNKLLRKYEYLFDGTLGTWNTEPLDLELKPNVVPYHAKAYPIPKAYEDTLKKECARLEQLGVLRKINRSEWAAPTFIIPKKDGTVRFISDFRELNKRIKRKPFPIPKIQDLLLKLEGFTYASSLDLNMGYYHIQLTPQASRLCTIVLPWGKYEYCRLPMGVCNSPDVFQEKMSELMQGLEFVRAYIDDLLVLTKSDWDDHLNKLSTVLNRIALAGLKINANKSFFGKTETEYLGFWISRTGIRPITKKVEAIQQLKPPKTRRELRRFIGIINYYRDMWIHRSSILAPLSRLTSKQVPWQWTDKEQKAFDNMKKIIGKEVLLSYPNFNQPFEIHTDASHTQLGSVISQNNKPIAFYSRKLSETQQRYTTTERELLSIVETLKEFRNILLGQEIIIYTDHKNLTYKEFNTERVMRWRLLIEEYGPEIKYIKGENNIVADALSRLDIDETNPTMEYEITNDMLAERYDISKLSDNEHPVTFRTIEKHQKKDRTLINKLKTNKNYTLKTFRGGEKSYDLVLRHDKIVIPSTLKRKVLEWYHTYLLHPGLNRTEETIRQHLWWKSLREDVQAHIKICDKCQRFKKQKKKYGHLPAKKAEDKPWERLCVDLVGPYKINRKDKTPLKMQAVTMIDPATGWFEIAEFKDKSSITIANIVEQQWLARYPRPTEVVYDRGSEFIGHEFKTMMEEEYGLKTKPITVRNPQANAIIERVHQTMGNLIRTFELEENYMDEDDPWIGILSATAFAIRSTYHTTLRGTPGQLVYGRDMILNINHLADWKAISLRKQQLINKNNINENNKRLQHTYHPGDKVLLENDNARKLECPRLGPYEVLEVYNNGTVTIRKGAVHERVNIRRILPYYE